MLFEISLRLTLSTLNKEKIQYIDCKNDQEITHLNYAF